MFQGRSGSPQVTINRVVAHVHLYYAQDVMPFSSTWLHFCILWRFVVRWSGWQNNLASPHSSHLIPSIIYIQIYYPISMLIMALNLSLIKSTCPLESHQQAWSQIGPRQITSKSSIFSCEGLFLIGSIRNPETRGNSMIMVNVVCLILATILLSLRVYTRVFMLKSWGWDDVLICISYVCPVPWIL